MPIGEIFKESEKLYETEEAYEENLELYEQLTGSLIMQNPDRAETISQNTAYLQRFVKGISICKKDESANNGGCTEPHISHVLAARLSSRPLARSETTLKHLAPILAAGKLTLNRKSTDNEQPVSGRQNGCRVPMLSAHCKQTGKSHLYKKFSSFRQTRIIRTHSASRYCIFSATVI